MSEQAVWTLSSVVCSAVWQRYALCVIFFNYTIHWIIYRAKQDYPGVRVAFVFNIVYINDIRNIDEEIRGWVNWAHFAFSRMQS